MPPFLTSSGGVLEIEVALVAMEGPEIEERVVAVEEMDS